MKKLFCALSLITISYAATQDLNLEIAKHYRSGNYQKALELARKQPAPASRQEYPTSYYTQAMCLFKLQRYDEASAMFEKVISYRNHPQDSHYFYAQSLLALGKKEQAKQQFQDSYNADYNRPYSKYFVHYIEKEMGELDSAQKGFADIYQHQHYQASIKQPAYYESVKILRDKFKQENAGKAPEMDKKLYVYNQFKSAYQLDTTSSLAPTIQKDMVAFDREFNLGLGSYVNGTKISEKKHMINFTQDFFYDSNVATLSNNQDNNTPTNVASGASNSTLRARYRFDLARQYTVAPEFELNYLKHSNQDSSLVYSNDSLIYGYALKNTRKHTLFGNPASDILDLQYSTTNRDFNSEKQLDYYGNNLGVAIGEKFKYFNTGETMIKLKQNQFAGHESNLDNSSLSLTLIQFMQAPSFRPDGESMLATMVYTQTQNKVLKDNDTTSYFARFDYIAPELYKGLDFNFAIGLTLIDPIKQRDERGLEKIYNPSLKVTKQFWNQQLFISAIYNYNVKTSKDEDNYAYTAQDIGIRTDLYF